MNKAEIATSVLADLETRLLEIEAIGALHAAAHLDAAIEALCRECGVERKSSKSD